MTEIDQAQRLLDSKFEGQFVVLPVDKKNQALKFFEDTMTTSYMAGKSRGLIQLREAGIARLFMIYYLGIPEEEISKALRRVELRVEKIKKRME